MARLEEFDDVQLDVEFTQAGTRSNLTSKENIAISFGKIAKWYEALVPTGGSSGQFLGFNSSGTAKWVSNPNVDEKVKAIKLAQSTSEASYYPTLVAGEGTAGVSIIDSAKINHTPGTTSIVGNTRLILGNGINEGATNNEAGLLRIYSPGTKYHTLKGAKITTDNVEHTLPTTGGTILNTGTTSFTQTLSSGTKIGTIKINGTSSDIYAPNDTDTKVTDTVGTANTYYPAGVTSTSTATGTQVFDTSLKFIGTTGSTSAVGKAQLVLGNATASGTANNKQGSIVVYGSTAYAHTIQGAPTAARTLTLPDKTGTFALTSDIPSVPTVNDAALTLKGAGTTVTTFTANASSAKSLDIVAGSNVTVTADATNAKISIAASHPTITKSTDTTSTVSPAHGGTFTVVDSITREANGHVTKINTKTVTLPADSNTDTKVTQSQTTTTNYRPILFGAKDSTDISTLANTVTDQAYTSTKMFAKPDTGILYASGFSTSSFINGTGAQLLQHGLYLKSYKSASLPAGGNYSYEEYAIRVYDGKAADNNGMLLTIDGGGLTIVGGGESAKSLAALISDDQRDSNTSRTRLDVGGTLNTAYHGSEEQLILSSDNNIYFLTTCQTIANRKPVVLDVNSYFYPGTTKTGSIGTSSYMWNSVYAATIYENGTSLASKYAAIGHTHSYLPLAGGTMTGDITFATISGDTYPISSKGIKWGGGTDAIDMYYNLRASDAGELIINMRDDSNVRTSFAYNGTVKSYIDTNGTYNGNASKTGIRWNAVSQGQKWSRLYYSETAVNNEGSNGILSISCLRGNVVVNAVFLVFVSHPGSNASHIIELASTNYSTIRCRVVSNSAGSYYFEIYDTANNIASGTSQTWHCCFVTLTDATLTTYTTFTDGSTIPSNFAAANDFTTTVGKASAAIKDISRSGTTFTATRQDGTTFTFTQQDNNTTYTVATGDSNGQIKVTPSSGSAYNVSVKGLGSAAYTASTSYVPINGKAPNGIGRDGYVAYATDGFLNYGTGTVTGALVITTPFTKTKGEVMLKFTVDIFNYKNNTSVEYKISGYAYNDGKWYNCTAYCVSSGVYSADNIDNLTVRFGYVADGFYQVQIGETTTDKWQYPRINIHDISVAYNRTNYTDANSGWSLEFVTSGNIPNITQTITNTAQQITPISVTSSTLDTTPGTFVFFGSGAPWTGSDWCGLQVGFQDDRFQIVASNGTLAVRQNDSSGTPTTTGWTEWKTLSTTDHTHNYAGSSSAGGPATNVAIARVSKDSKVFPGANKVVFEEYSPGTNYNLPGNHWYHIMSAQGNDTNYGTQLALGMTATAAYYRVYNNRTWSDWKSLINTDTTYSANNGVGLSGTTFYNSGVRAVSTGSANGTISVNTNGTSADVAVKGLASAAYVTQESLLRARSTVSTDGGATGWSQIGINQYNGAFPDGVTNKIYNYGAVVSMPAPNARFDLYYNHISSSADHITNGLQYRTGWNDDKKAWRMLIDNVNYTEYMPYKKPIKFQFNNGITNGYWAKLFSANYSSYNILEIDIVTYHGYDGNYRSKLHIRFTNAGFVPGDSSIISHQNIAPDSLRITQDDTNTFSLWIKCDGTSSRFGYEILNISDESSVFFNGVTLTAERWSFPTTFTKSDTAPTNAVTATRYFALDNHTHNYAGSSSAGGAATSANILNKNNTAGATTTGVQYANGQLTVGTADGNAVEGSNGSYKLWSYPAGGTAVGGGTANIQNLRLYWSSAYFRDIFISPNNYDIYHRSVAAGTAQPWRKVLDSGNYTSYALPRNIKHIHTASGTEGSVGWVKIARITVTADYPNHPMTFTIAQRGVMQYRIHLVLKNYSVAHAAISEFIIARDNSWTDTNNYPRAYIIKPSDGIFDLYIRKIEAYDHIFVVDFTKADGSEGDNYSVTWTNVHAADSEITGGTEAVKKLYLSTSGGTMTGELKQTTQLRIYSGNYGTIFRNDGTNTFFLLTESGSAESGSWNSLRPLYFSNSTGKVTIGNGLTVYNGITGDLTGNVTGNCSGSSGSCTGNSATSTRANYLDVVAGNEVRFYNDNQFKEARHFWLGYSWADGSHYTPSGGSDTSSITAPNITKFVMGNCSRGGLASVHANTFILGNGISPTLSSKTTTITTAATTTDRTITLPDDSGTVALTSKTFNVTRGSSVSTATTGYWAAMCASTQAGSPTLPTAAKWWHVISMDWSNNDTNWISQLAVATIDGSGVWWRRNNASGTSIDSSTWHRLAEGDSSGNAVQATKLRSSAARTDSSVGTADTTPYQKYWVKIASCYTTENYTDLESLWAVNDVYGNRQGILKVRARVEGTAGTFGNTRTIRWLVADNSIDVNMFAIVCYNNRKPDGTEATGTATVELWWKSAGQYDSFSFVLLDETRRTGKQPNDWTLYDTSTYGQAALPTTGNITYSVAATILNSTTGNAATATKATQDGNGNNISSTYIPIKTGDGIAECSGNGKYLYYTIATITISGAYVNHPILFEISGRGHHFTRLEVEFANSSSTDTGLDTNGFVADGYHGFWIKKTATSTWVVYGKYTEKWGNAVLHRITGCGTSVVTVTVNMTNYGNSLPDGCTQVTYGWMAILADRALKADKASKLSTSSAIGSDTQPVYFDSDGYPTACYPMSRTSTIYDNSSGTSTIISDLTIPADTKYFKIFIFDFNTSGSHYVTNVIDIGVDDGYYGGVISGSSQSQSFPCVITVVQLIVATTSNNRKQISIGRSSSWTIGASPSSSTHTLYIRKIIACT